MTNKTYSELLGGAAGSSASAGGWQRPIISSKTINIDRAGILSVSLLGAAAGGAFLAAAGAVAGPNSAPWGRKLINVTAGDVVVVNIGAGGLKGASSGVPGSPGGTSTVTLNGVAVMTVPSGEAGVIASGTATASPSAVTATVTGADFWVPGVQAGSAQANSGTSASGGAAPDLLMLGVGRSPSVAGTAAGGVGGSVGTDAGGIPIPWVALADWGFVITDGSTASSTVGSPGRGGAAAILPGPFGGGAGTISGANNQPGGYGAGGGSGYSAATCFNGGGAYAYLYFVPL